MADVRTRLDRWDTKQAAWLAALAPWRPELIEARWDATFRPAEAASSYRDVAREMVAVARQLRDQARDLEGGGRVNGGDEYGI